MGARRLPAASRRAYLAADWTLVIVLLLARELASGLLEKECRLDFFRLPRRVQPTNYTLLIRPNLVSFTYSAKLTIQLLVHDQEPQQDGSGNFCPRAGERDKQRQGQQLKRKKKQTQEQKQKLKQKQKQSQSQSQREGKRRKSAQVHQKGHLWLACDRSKIVLHAHQQLKISSLEFRPDNSGPMENHLSVQVRELCRDFKNELLVVGLDGELSQQTAGELRIHFSGPIRDDMHGFFRSEYRDELTDKPAHMAVTHFQAAHARKAFPCFDEPDFKANFNLIVEHASHLKALSNTHVLREERVRRWRAPHRLGSKEEGARKGLEGADGRLQDIEGPHGEEPEFVLEELTRVHFAQTPRMSTYLLAFAVGQFDHIETRVGKLGLAIWTPPGRAHLARYALKFAARAYGALRDYFNIEQPLEKIDFLAVRELDAGAMENWGLIMFTEHFLLLDENNTTPDDINYATDSITHELSHQWFGNLVTMRWWDDLWLNEGFATWITQVINQQLEPSRDGELVYLMDALNGALNSDAARKTHPIRNVQLQTASEIEGSFDDITYEKASAVIRMLNDYMGPGQFKLAIKGYLEANQYQNTEALDLWRWLESTSELDMGQLMSSWLDQAGFPLIRVRLSRDGRSLRVDQERFLERDTAANQTREPNAADAGRQKWVVPLTMWISNGCARKRLYRVVLSERGANIRLPSWFEPRRQGHWLKLNANFSGFYRVSYDDLRLFRALRLPIEHKLMAPSDRLNFICDTFALLANERLDMRQFDEALSWFWTEDNDAVLEVLGRYIASLEAHQYPTGWNRTKLLLDYYEREGKFAINKANSWLRLRARASVASSLVAIQNRPVMRDALELFERLGAGGVPAVFRLPIFSAVARAGTADQIQRLILLVQRLEPARQSQSRLVDAMTESMAPGARQAHRSEGREKLARR